MRVLGSFPDRTSSWCMCSYACQESERDRNVHELVASRAAQMIGACAAMHARSLREITKVINLLAN